MARSKLLNEFSWSFSRRSVFTECQKKYWYTYYGSWEGWPKTPYDSRPFIDPLASYLYALKQMQHLPMFVGSCVHEVIENFLKTYQTSRKKKPLDELQEEARTRFQKGIEDSEMQKWRKAPKKHSNLFEHYYKPSDQEIALDTDAFYNALQKISTSIDNWYNSPIVQQMAFSPQAKWLSIEELAHFLLQDPTSNQFYKILVVIDFAMKWKMKNDEEAAILFDWKTGEETDKTEDQLYSYALFANRVWKTPLDRIILTPFYVFKNSYSKIGYQQKEPIHIDKLQVVENQILTSCQEMWAKIPPSLPGQEPKQPDVRLFAYTDERRKCTRCPFKELCTKVDFQDLSEQELRERVQSVPSAL